jgi:DNA polymerase III alpha subunit
MKLASEQNMPAVAMTDHGNLFGAVEFYNSAKEKGVHPVIGCEVYITQQSHTVKNESNRYNHLVLLAENQEGYKNLTSLVSSAFLDGFYYKPRIDKDLLAKHSKGIIAMSACLRGDINEALMGDRYEEGKRLAMEYRDIFGPGTSSSRCRTTGSIRTASYCRCSTASPVRPGFRLSSPTIRTTCERTTRSRRKCWSASTPARRSAMARA